MLKQNIEFRLQAMHLTEEHVLHISKLRGGGEGGGVICYIHVQSY